MRIRVTTCLLLLSVTAGFFLVPNLAQSVFQANRAFSVLASTPTPPVEGYLIFALTLLAWRRRRPNPLFLAKEWARHPRFLLLGPHGSGKTSLMQSLARYLPRTGSGPDHLLQGNYRWWFFDEAVVLDPDGSMVIDRGGAGADENAWSALLRALRNDRPSRPLDGVILALSIEDLAQVVAEPVEGGTEDAGESTPGVEETARRRAILLKEKLRSIEKVLGMRLPIYVIITKSDLFPEFQSLCESLPRELLDSAFGWSNPYSLESVHDPRRTTEALEEIHRRLHVLLLERFAEEDPVASAEDFFLLPRRFHSVAHVLSIYVNTMFRESIHTEGSFFRGLYFAGTRKVASVVRAEGIERRVTFIKDLFQRKIFTEWSLARPIQRTLLSRNRTVFWIQVGIMIFTLVSSIGLYFNYRGLQEAREPIRTAIVAVGHGLQRLRIEFASRSKVRAAAHIEPVIP